MHRLKIIFNFSRLRHLDYPVLIDSFSLIAANHQESFIRMSNASLRWSSSRMFSYDGSMKRYGVIDLGSNTIRLVVYDVEKPKGDSHRSFDVASLGIHKVLDDKKTIGLSQYVEDSKLTKEGVKAATNALTRLLADAKAIDAQKIGAFATAVIRNCSNSQEVLECIKDKAHCKISLLSGEEEAYLGYVGATYGNDATKGFLIDIGGGSTELSVIGKDGGLTSESLPIGCVSTYARFVRLVLPTRSEMRKIRKAAKELVAKVGFSAPSAHALGIGGSIRAISKFVSELCGDRNEQGTIKASELAEFFWMLEHDESAFAHLAVKSAPDRVHSIACGAVILQTVMDHFSIMEVEVCKHGIREGYLLKRMLGL